MFGPLAHHRWQTPRHRRAGMTGLVQRALRDALLMREMREVLERAGHWQYEEDRKLEGRVAAAGSLLRALCGGSLASCSLTLAAVVPVVVDVAQARLQRFVERLAPVRWRAWLTKDCHVSLCYCRARRRGWQPGPSRAPKLCSGPWRSFSPSATASASPSRHPRVSVTPSTHATSPTPWLPSPGELSDAADGLCVTNPCLMASTSLSLRLGLHAHAVCQRLTTTNAISHALAGL